MKGKYQVIADALGELEEEEFLDSIKELLEADPSAENAEQIVNACALGMEKVGEYFEQDEYFVGELIYAADILQNGFELLNPYLSDEEASKKLGTMVIGTAPGDLHDIGKNIFRSMMEAAGFAVHDLGVDVKPEIFVEKLKKSSQTLLASVDFLHYHWIPWVMLLML